MCMTRGYYSNLLESDADEEFLMSCCAEQVVFGRLAIRRWGSWKVPQPMDSNTGSRRRPTLTVSNAATELPRTPKTQC